MNILKKFYAYIQYREAVRLANKLHSQNGERFFVVPSTAGKLIVTDRKYFKQLKDDNYIDCQCTLKDLKQQSFYYTPAKNKKTKLSIKKLKYKKYMYYKWYSLATIKH